MGATMQQHERDEAAKRRKASPMTGRNPWRRPRDGDPRMTDATDDAPADGPTYRSVTADATDGDGPAAVPTPADGIEAMNGEPIAPLTVEEQAWLRRIAAWYLQRCRDAGVASPPDILRCIAACANEVVSYNEALAEQARRDADGAPDRPKPH